MEAYRELRKVTLPYTDVTKEIALKATEGLINFRMGKIEIGKAFYFEAINLAKQNSRFKHLALASINFAREMFFGGQLTKVDAISFAETASKSSSDPDVIWLLEKLKSSIMGAN